jgi:RNA polymerase sigma factor (sigma-70 family)
MLHHHHRTYIEAVEAERRAKRIRGRADELDALLRAVNAGDGTAWRRLIERFTSRVRAVTRAYRLNAHDADDVMQTTWLRLLERIDGIREPAAVGAWIETTARRESLRVLRVARREWPTDSDQLLDAPVDAVAERRLVAAQDRAAYDQALTRLPEALTRLPQSQQRLLSMLLSDPAPSYAEISRRLDMPIGSIGPIRARCIARLRRDPELARAIGMATA